MAICLLFSGKQLMYNYAGIYDHNLPDSFKVENPNIAAVIEGKHVTKAPWYHSTVLASADGEKFTSFAKYTDFDAGKQEWSISWLCLEVPECTYMFHTVTVWED